MDCHGYGVSVTCLAIGFNSDTGNAQRSTLLFFECAFLPSTSMSLVSMVTMYVLHKLPVRVIASIPRCGAQVIRTDYNIVHLKLLHSSTTVHTVVLSCHILGTFALNS